MQKNYYYVVFVFDDWQNTKTFTNKKIALQYYKKIISLKPILKKVNEDGAQVVRMTRENFQQYQQAKEKARFKIFDEQMKASESAESWGELAERLNNYEKLAKRYGLIKELKREGIF